MAVAAISILLTKAKVTRWFRTWLSKRTSLVGRYFNGLFQCPYCMSHPWSLAAAILYRLRVIEGRFYWLDIVTSALFMIVPASVFSFLLFMSTKLLQKNEKGNANEQGKEKVEP
jgi:hypothetical protein